MDNGDFVVEAHSIEQKMEVESLHLKFVDGHGQMFVAPVFESLSISQCMDCLLSSVENDEDLEETRKALGMGRTYAIETKTPKPNKKINAKENAIESPKSPKPEIPQTPNPSSQSHEPQYNFPFFQPQNAWGKGWGQGNWFPRAKGKGFVNGKGGNNNFKGAKGRGKGQGKGKGDCSHFSSGRGKGKDSPNNNVNEVSQESFQPTSSQ